MKIRLFIIIVILIILTLSAQFGLLRIPPVVKYPYIIFITIDTFNVFQAQVYTRYSQRMAYFQRLKSEGLLFQYAHTSTPFTVPAHATIFTGLYPSKHMVLTNESHLSSEHITLAEILKENGYDTGAFISLGVLSSKFGLNQGFITYDDVISPEWRKWYRDSYEIFPQVKGWILSHFRKPFFLWIHLADTHEPYAGRNKPPDALLECPGVSQELSLTRKLKYVVKLTLPPGKSTCVWTPIRKPRDDDFKKTQLYLSFINKTTIENFTTRPLPETIVLRKPWSLDFTNDDTYPKKIKLVFQGGVNAPPPSEVFENYNQEIRQIDLFLQELDDILTHLQIKNRTLLVLVSDHGEGLYRHHVLGHASYVFEDQLRILYYLRGPGIPKGRLIKNCTVHQIDLFPTILDLLDIEPPQPVDGSSLRPIWRKNECSTRDSWWAYGIQHKRNAVTAFAEYSWPYKLIYFRNTFYGAYNVQTDPFETMNLMRKFRFLRRRIPEFRPLFQILPRHNAFIQNLLKTHKSRSHDREVREILKSLGYIDTK